MNARNDGRGIVAGRKGWLWAKLDVDYLDNPKIEALSDAGLRLHLSLILKAKKQGLAGVLAANACTRYGDAALKELLDGGLLHRIDAKRYQLHDYGDHQTDPEKDAQTSQHRSEAGSRGGHTKNHARRFIYDEGCDHCQDDAARSEDWLKDPRLTLKAA